MEIITGFWWILFVLFLASGAYILKARAAAKNEVKAQFVVMGCVLVVFYCVCFLSGICTILNFLWRWVF